MWWLFSASLLLLLGSAAIARAQVVHEFDYQLTNVKPYGGFTVVFSARSYDTTGSPPPPLTSAYLRLPADAKLRREFLTRRFLCNVAKLERTKDPRVCKHAEVGRGSVLVDARPIVTEVIPARIYLFLAKPEDSKAVASIAILGIPDDSSPVVRNNPLIRESKVVLQAQIFDDPTPDGLFGYKIVLPVGPIRGVNISVAEVRVKVSGLTLTKRVRKCLKRKGARCGRSGRTERRLYWFTLPRCPNTRRYSFEIVLQYQDIPAVTHRGGVPCPRFKR